MRARLATIPFAVATLALIGALAPLAHADEVTLAQDDSGVGQEDEGPTQEQVGDEGGGAEEGGGQDEPEAETGAGRGEQEEAAEEAGPPWTYQMARIGLVLLVLVGAGIGLMYYRLIVQRQRGGI